MKESGLQLPFNPFVDIAVGNPWKSDEPDVRSINSGAYDGLLRLIRQLDKTPHLAALVLGSAGSGKTHLIKRLLQSRDADVLFVYVHPMKDHKRVFTTLMEHVSTNLAARTPWVNETTHATQLDLTVVNVITAAFEHYLCLNPEDPGRIYLKSIKKDPLKILSFRKSRKWNVLIDNAQEFLKDRPSFQSATSKKVLRALFQYLDKSKREAVCTFLSGTIPDQEECEALGLIYGEGDWSIEAQEQRSKDILKTVGGLLEFYRPMVLCFDQLDSIESPELIRATGTLFMDIVNEIENVLPIAFMRPENWENHFKKHLDQSAEDRIKSQCLSLEGCNVDQALDIVKERLAWAFRAASEVPLDPFFPYDRSMIEKRLKGVTSPRDVLSIANSVLSKGKQPQRREDPTEVVKKQFEAERERLLALGEKEPLRQDTVVAAFKLYFENQKDRHGYRAKNVEVSGGDIRLHAMPTNGAIRERVVEIRVETAIHWNPLGKSLERVKRSLESHLSDFVFLIRDDRCRIPPKKGSMPKTVEKLREFQRAGGHLHYIDYQTLTTLYALVHTWDKIGAGDLSYISGQHGERDDIDLATFLWFVRQEFNCDLLNRLEFQFLEAERAKGQRVLRPSAQKEKEICSAIQSILDEAPYKLKLEQILVRLEERGIVKDLTHSFLAELIGKHSDRFGNISVTPPLYFLKK
ncbi:MAG: hypothetical protein WBG50_20685 [Desulfomonilaceae bacterium]